MARQEPTRCTDISLYASDGLLVEWGRPGSLRADEPSVEIKLRNLHHALDHFPPDRTVRGIRVQFAHLGDVSFLHPSGEQTVARVGGSFGKYVR